MLSLRLLCLLALAACLSLVSGAPHPALAVRSELSTFCDKFRASCRDVCLRGQSGPQHIKFGCEKNATTKNYEFLCECNGHIKTGSAVDGVTGPKPIYTTASTSTFTTTSTVEIDSTKTSLGDTTSTRLQTHSSTFSLPVKSTTTTRTLQTTTTKDVAGTGTSYSRTTKTSTRTISVGTEISPTVTTLTRTDTVLSIVASTGAPVPGEKFFRVATPNKGSGSVASSVFCKGYATSCDRTCTRLGSSASKTTCKRTDTDTVTRYYDLYCKCANGKVETSHALADIDGAIEGTPTVSVTVVSTSISYTSFTVTETLAVATRTSTILSTKSVVVFDPPPSTITRTLEATSISTSLHPTDGTVTLKTTSTAPRVTKTVITSTVTSPQTATISATTMLAIAPTGRMRVDHSGAETRGYLASTWNGTRAGAINSTSEALNLVLVASPNNRDAEGSYYASYGLVDMATGKALVPEFDGSQYESGTSGPLGIPGTIEQAEAAGYDVIYWLLRENIQGSTSVPAGGTLDMGFSVSYESSDGYFIVRVYSREPKIGASKDKEPYLFFGNRDPNAKAHPSFTNLRARLTFEFSSPVYSL